MEGKARKITGARWRHKDGSYESIKEITQSQIDMEDIIEKFDGAESEGEGGLS